jgi:hypothetical protein
MSLLILLLSLLPPLSEESKIHYIAQVTCSECQTCSDSEKLAVIQVIKNRVRYTSTRPNHWWGHGLVRVLRYPQFAKMTERCRVRSDYSSMTPYQVLSQKRIKKLYDMVRRTLNADAYPSMSDCYYFHAKTVDPKWELVPCPGRSNWYHHFYTKRKLKKK